MGNNKQEKQELINMLVSSGMSAKDIAEVLRNLGYGAQQHDGKRTDAPKELVDFTKADGTVVKCTAAQAAAWSKWREGAPERKAQFEAMKATWASKKASYKPSKELITAIKANRAAVTHAIARDKFGFVGTKQDLKALKESICK